MNNIISPQNRNNKSVFSSVGMMVPILVLFFSLTAAVVFWWMLAESISQKARITYEDATSEITRLIVKRLHDQEQILLGAVGLFNASKVVTRDMWRHYVASLQLDLNHPGILGVGYSAWLTPAEKEANIISIRADGFPEYIIKPENPRPVYTSIIYLEPFNWRNQRAFGYDMYTEAIRKAAMDKAIDSGATTIAAKIILLQETDIDKQSGMLMYAPVYRQGMATDSADNRRKAIKGFVYSPIRMNDFVYGTLGKLPQDVAFNIYSDETEKAESLLFSSILADKTTLPKYFHPVFSSSVKVEAYGRTWAISYKSLPTFIRHLDKWKSYSVLFMGVSASIFLSALSYSLLSTRNKAVAMALVMTKELSDLNMELSDRAKAAELSEKAKAESEERLQLVLDGNNDGIWDWDVQTGRTEFNKRWANMIGYSPDEIIHRVESWWDMVHPVDAPEFRRVLDNHLNGISPFYECEHRVQIKDGQWLWIHDRGKVVLRGEYGVPLRMAGTRTDISARKKLEEQIHEQTEMLELEMAERQLAQEALSVKQIQLEVVNSSLLERVEEAVAELRQKDRMLIGQSRQAAMGEMIGNIAHQWRQPINALAMLLGNIQQAYEYNELTPEYINKCVENGNRLIQKMSSTINDFRNFFLPDKEAVLFSVNDQIANAISLVDSAFKIQNISIVREDSKELMLTGFPNEYSQVLLNLLSNAKDAITNHDELAGKITIRMYENKGHGCVAVSDNGGGINIDVIDKIFEPYFSTKSLGTGIGLYMSKMIIERSMKGSIEAHNIEGGAELIIMTPLEGGFA